MGDIMGKHIEMLRCFRKVLLDDRKEINKVVPMMYCNSFYDIDLDFLKENNINKLIVDIDGTILPADDINVPNELKERFDLIKEKNIDVCLVSNNSSKRVMPVVKELRIDKYLYEAKKPLPICFDRSMKLLGTTNKKEVAMVGDQMLSDIKGASEYGLYTILVRPISKHQNIQTGTSRVLQNIMEHHLKKLKLFNKDRYYKKKVR